MMKRGEFEERKMRLLESHELLVSRRNEPLAWTNGVVQRWRHPVLTAEHTPVFWRYDLDPETNPYLMERLGVNAVFNPGAIAIGETYYLVARVEGVDRKSYLAIAESSTGVDGFSF